MSASSVAFTSPVTPISTVTGEHRLGPGSEAGDLLVSDVHPLNVAAPDGIRDEVQRITWHAQQCFTPAACNVETTISSRCHRVWS